MARRMQRRNEKFFTLSSKAGSNVVESAAILMEFAAAPHERWAKLAKRMLDTEHAGDDTTQVVDPEQGSCQDEGTAVDGGLLVVTGKRSPRPAMITPRTRPPLRLRHQRLDPSPRRLAEFC